MTTKAASAAGKALAAQRKMVNKTCRHCGTPFVGLSTREFCKPACRLKEWRAQPSQQADP